MCVICWNVELHFGDPMSLVNRQDHGQPPPPPRMHGKGLLYLTDMHLNSFTWRKVFLERVVLHTCESRVLETVNR